MSLFALWIDGGRRRRVTSKQRSKTMSGMDHALAFPKFMHAAIDLLVYWGLAFLALGLSVFLLAIFDAVTDNDLIFLSPVKEIALAAVASLIQALGVWLIVVYFHGAARAVASRGLIIPLLMVALIYKIAHLEDWSRYDILMLFAFQLAVCCFGICLAMADFAGAFWVLLFFGIVLSGVVFFKRNT